MRKFWRVDQFLLHSFIGRFLKPDSLVVDLGANRGEFSEFIAHKYGCRVLAVEPVPQVFKAIKDGGLIKKFNYCIAGKSEKRKLSVPLDTCANLYQRGDTSQVVEVNCVTLDNFLEENHIEHVDLLKIDIEGAEIELFESIKKEILDRIDQITVEFHDFLWPELKPRVEAIKKKLTRGGYYCIPFSLTNNGDVLFVKKGLISKWQYYFMKHLLRYIMGAKRRVKRVFGK